MPDIENGTSAWNRWVQAHKRHKGWPRDYEIPIRLRGYSEVTMKHLDGKERKAIDSALRRGYSLSRSPLWQKVLEVILKTVDWNIGYMGKTKANLWFPDSEARDACLKHMEAQLVMTNKFSARDLYARGSHGLIINVNSRWDEALKSHFTELRQVVDEHMDMWADQRIRLADRLLPDEAVVRVPFDTYKGRGEKT